MEMLLVLTVLGLLAGLAASVSVGKIRSSKESALKEDLRLMRKAIDDFYADRGRYPAKLGELVEERYLRSIPEDPFTGSRDTWREIQGKDASGREGLEDVRSGSGERSGEGEPYDEW